MKVRVPKCCAANLTFGFVRVTETFQDPMGEFADKWETTIVDMTGVSHTMDTKRCPVCGAAVVGLEWTTIERTPIRLDPVPPAP